MAWERVCVTLKVKDPCGLSHLAQFSGWPKPEALSRWNLVASLILVLNMNQDIVVKSKIQLCLKKSLSVTSSRNFPVHESLFCLLSL